MIEGKKKGWPFGQPSICYLSQDSRSAFALRFQTARANVHTDLTAVLVKRRLLNIGAELPIRFLLRETNIVARHRSLAANLTFSHNFTLS
jgi:hypothetical protein